MTDPAKPTVDAVLERLRGGARAQVGRGRYYETFFFQGTALKVEVFDEGHRDVFDSTVEALASSMKHEPVAFEP